MVDPASAGTGLVALLGAHQTAKAISRLLGPAADEVAEAVARWTAWRLRNVERVGAVANARAGDAAGTVDARLAMKIFEEASYSENEIIAEYLGGVLASSRAEGDPDDRGIAWSSLIGRLSVQQLRLHYMLYDGLRRLNVGSEASLATLCAQDIFISYADIWAVLGDAGPVSTATFADAFYGLARERLVGDQFGFGPPEHLRTGRHRTRAFPEPGGLVFHASRPGIALFLWGHGKGDQFPTAIRDADQIFSLVDYELPSAEAVLVTDLDEHVGEAGP